MKFKVNDHMQKHPRTIESIVRLANAVPRHFLMTSLIKRPKR